MLLPTTLVGSYAQPEWLIDRAKLAGRFPPRVRAKELWRIPEPYLAEAQDDATLLAIKLQEEAGLDIVTDGEIRRESYSNRFATALDGIDIDNPGVALDRSGHPNPVPRIVGKIRRKHAVEVGDLNFLRRHTQRKVKMTVPGPFTMSQQAQNDFYPSAADAAMDYAEAVNAEIKDLFAAGADIVQIDEPYMQARPVPAGEYGLAALNKRARRRRGRDRGPHLFRLRSDHPPAAQRLLVPDAAQDLPVQADFDRNGAVESRLLRAEGVAGPKNHSRRARLVDARGRNAENRGRAHPARASLPQARGHHRRPGLRPQISAARFRLRQDEGDGRGRPHGAGGTGGWVEQDNSIQARSFPSSAGEGPGRQAPEHGYHPRRIATLSPSELGRD